MIRNSNIEEMLNAECRMSILNNEGGGGGGWSTQVVWPSKHRNKLSAIPAMVRVSKWYYGLLYIYLYSWRPPAGSRDIESRQDRIKKNRNCIALITVLNRIILGNLLLYSVSGSGLLADWPHLDHFTHLSIPIDWMEFSIFI